MGRHAIPPIGMPVLQSLADKGMSQEMIARELQVSRDLIRKWLKGYGIKTHFKAPFARKDDAQLDEPFAGERTRPTAFAIACARPFDELAWQAVDNVAPRAAALDVT